MKPGESLAVPLKLSFLTEAEAFKDKTTAEKIYGWIKKAPAGKLFSTSKDVFTTPVLKLRESFAPPSVPPHPNYVYGPEFVLKGIGIDGQTIDFKEASRNLLTLSDEPGFGSCPYLYAWDDRDGVWVSRGKVIDDARGKSKETTQRISFAGFRSKFRLAEEELEVSYIDHVKLEVELKDGTGMSLKPDFAAMAEQDARYATIKAGDRIEFSFRAAADRQSRRREAIDARRHRLLPALLRPADGAAIGSRPATGRRPGCFLTTRRQFLSR